MQRLANQFFLDGDVEDVADGEKDGTNKSEDGDKDKQIPEDDRAKDRKPQDDSITEDIDFSILDRMKKFNPTKYGKDFNFAFPKFTCGDCSSGILLTIGDKEYFTQLIKTERWWWWDAESIVSYAQLAAHDAHAASNDFSVLFLNAFRTSKLWMFVRKPTL
jgi:hypothetical protein